MKIFLLLPLLLLMSLGAGAQCVASITAASAPLNTQLLRFSFTNTSTYGTLINKQYVHSVFNFGDGNFSAGPSNAVHNYASAGTYTVGMRFWKLDSSHNVICTDTFTQVITAAYPPCGSNFTITGNPGNSTRTFTASTPAATSGMSYSWNFGDGNTGTGATVNHTYAAAGFYAITLTATSSSSSCSFTTTKNTWIMYTGLVCDSLKSSFTFSRSGKYVIVNPGHISWFPGLVANTTYDYGDGSAPTTALSHTYASGGNYTIKQRVQWLDSVTSAVTCTDSNTRPNSFHGVIAGYLLYDSLNFTGPQNFKVWLIRHDSASGMLTAVDSTTVTHAGYVHYIFNAVIGGNYLVKAARIYTTPSASGLVPTYHDSSLYWSGAALIANPGYSTNFAHIWMKNGAATTGPGFIGGNVSLGANKGTANDCVDVNILLRSASGEVVASVLTDNSGDFAFSNIPEGSYNVYPEVMNYVTTPAAVDITAGAPTANPLYFFQDDVKMNIMAHSLHTPGIAGSSVYTELSPNPASGTVTLRWSGMEPRTAEVLISNTTGQLVARQAMRLDQPSGKISLDISTISSGIYFVRLTGVHGGTPLKLVIR